MGIDIIHTEWKIVKQDFEEYKSAPWRTIQIMRPRQMIELNEEGVKEYAHSQLGKTYDWPALFIHLIYIITLPLQRLFKSKRPWWIGPVGKDAQHHHVCSEFAAWCIKLNAQWNIFPRPWIETAESISKNLFLRPLEENETPQTGDIGLVRSVFMWRHPKSWALSWLSATIRFLTRSYYNHVVVIINA